MTTVREQISWRYSSQSKYLGGLSMIEEAAKGLEILDADFWIDFGVDEYIQNKLVAGPYLRMNPKHVPGIAIGMGKEGPTLALVDATPTLGDAARVLLPKVGKWEKSFDEEHNLLSITGYYQGVRIVIEDTPPDTCKVRKIEEDVDVPEKIILAHVEKKVRYVLEGDCDPLMTARDMQPEKVSSGEQNSLDIPF